MENLINFNEAKKRFLPDVIYVGDLVEWKDYDGQLYCGIVKGIEHLPLEGFSFSESLDMLPFWEKEDYSITFEDGFSIAGCTLTRKIIKGLNKPRSNKALLLLGSLHGS